MYASSYSTGYTVSGNSTIAVVIGGSADTDKLYVKQGGAWKEVQKAYRNVNGTWTEITDLTTVFTAGTKYVCGD